MIRARACSPTTATAENKMRTRGARSPLFFTAESRRGAFCVRAVRFCVRRRCKRRFFVCGEGKFPVSVAKTFFLWYNGQKGARAERRGRVSSQNIPLSGLHAAARVFVMLLRCARLCRRVPAAAAARVRKVKKGGFNEHLARYFRKAHP